MTRSLLAAAVALAFILSQAVPARAETTAASSSGTIPEQIPVGNAEDDPVTSQAVMEILRECAEQYSKVKSFRATGTYIEAARVERSGKPREEQSASQLEILYRRPDRLKVSVTGPDVAAGFVADGTTVTMLWPSTKQYRQIPQPDSLAAFAEEERAGEIREDETNAIVYSVVGSLLISEDPLRWLHANVKTYFYDGTEDVRGRPAWRIKFLQSDPQIVVINWVDKQTKLLSKVSIIQARDSKGEFVESYAESAYGRIRIAVLDHIETSETPLPEKLFTAAIPRDWKPRKEEVSGKPRRGEQVSAWERLVRAAAAKKGAETSPTLVTQSGGSLLHLERIVEQPSKVTGLANAGEALGGERSLAAASENLVVFLNHGGKKLKSLPVRGEPDLLTMARGAETSGPVLVTAATYGSAVRAYGLEGGQLWTYEHPGARISSLVAARPPEATTDSLYVGYLGGTGLRVLAADGSLRFASRRLTGITALAAGDIPGVGWRVVASTGSAGGFFNARGEFLSKLPEEENSDVQVGLLALDSSQTSAPFVEVAAVGEAEYVLRRVRPDNSIVWTVPLAQEVREAEPVAVMIARLKIAPQAAAPANGEQSTATQEEETTATADAPASYSEGEPRPFAVTLLSDGRMTLVSAEGKVVWRGKATFGGAGSSGDVEHAAASLLTADLDGNGEDEIYVGGEGSVLQIVPGP